MCTVSLTHKLYANAATSQVDSFSIAESPQNW